MSKRSRWVRFTRFTMAAAVGGTVFGLSGCDPAVRTTVLTGLETTTQSLAQTLITAWFLSMDDDSGSGTSLTTT
ncbi:MAG: hypothetical protein KJ749_00125 [Planctomycetes bacterium]|nr:hypothetical protein [Planctomycetota bacterium]